MIISIKERNKYLNILQSEWILIRNYLPDNFTDRNTKHLDQLAKFLRIKGYSIVINNIKIMKEFKLE